ncbi:phage scaffolding protein [Aneurinibacillus aneurinilyticus]|uniref:Scaffold protein n=1 Tax=Aneurinibacillus aneurinilyticus TaxID=1391 RepID=A0A848CY05_ANEAE|nr:phage scaffolding protein [Aneurinibacillus aneurinilyticus]NMF00009.1 hypothetical protein [Aneurinibacillus aneurinilyticus]
MKTKQLRKVRFHMNLQHFAEPTTDPEPNAEPAAEPKTSDNEPHKQPEGKTIPYDRFKAVNDDLKTFKETFRELGIEGIDGLKSLATTFSELKKAEEERKRAEMSEIERYQADLEAERTAKQTLEQRISEMEASIQREKINAEFIKVATSHNIAYIDDAKLLADLSAVKIDENGNVVGIEEVVKALVENKPFLLGTKKVPQTIGGPTNHDNDSTTKTADQLLQEAADKARKSGKPEDIAAFSKLKRELGM